MDFNELNTLIKRVNLEEDLSVKHRLIDIIESYMISSNPEAGMVENPFPLASIKSEEPKEPNLFSAHIENVPHISTDIEAVVNPVEQQDSEEVESTEKKELFSGLNAYEEEMPQDEPGTEMMWEISDTNITDASPEEDVHGEPSLPSSEPIPVEGEEDTSTVETEEPGPVKPISEGVSESSEEFTGFIENFGLVSTTTDEHIAKLIENGAVLFKVKRSFNLGLALDDEMLALGRTQKLEQLPEAIQKHLNADGFFMADVIEIGEIEKKSRARYVDITLSNLVEMEEGHWIRENVMNLLENGEVPEHIKKQQLEEKSVESPQLDAIEPDLATVTEPILPLVKDPLVVSEENNIQETEEAKAQEENDTLQLKFLIHPTMTQPFLTDKEGTIQKDWGIRAQDRVAKLFYRNTDDKMMIVGMDDKSELPNSMFGVNIVDYIAENLDGRTFITFTLTMKVEEEPVIPQPPKVEEIMDQPYQPEDMRTVAGVTADSQDSVNEMVSSLTTDTSGAIEEIRSHSSVSTAERQEILSQAENPVVPGAIADVLSQTMTDTGIYAKTETTPIVGNLEEGSGNLSKNDVVIQFKTQYTPDSWSRSVNKRIELASELNFDSDITSKAVSIVGKNGSIVGVGQTPVSEAVLADGNRHTALLESVTQAYQGTDGYLVSLHLVQFEKVV